MGVIKFFKNMYSVFFGNDEEEKEEKVHIRTEITEQEIKKIDETQPIEDEDEDKCFQLKHRFCILGDFAENDFFTNKVSELSKFTSIPLSTVYRLLKKAEKEESYVINYKEHAIIINAEYQDEIA